MIEEKIANSIAELSWCKADDANAKKYFAEIKSAIENAKEIDEIKDIADFLEQTSKDYQTTHVPQKNKEVLWNTAKGFGIGAILDSAQGFMQATATGGLFAAAAGTFTLFAQASENAGNPHMPVLGKLYKLTDLANKKWTELSSTLLSKETQASSVAHRK